MHQRSGADASAPGPDQWYDGDGTHDGPDTGWRRHAALLLGAGVLATFVATSALVAAHSGPAPAGAVTDAPTATPPPVASTAGGLPDVRALPLGEATAALETAGAFVTVAFQAQWERPIGADWLVCRQAHADPADGGTIPDVHLTAVPPGDPCG